MFPMKKSEMMAMIWTMKNIHFFIWGKVRINYKIWLVCFRFTTTSWVPLLPFNFNSQQIKKNQKKESFFFERATKGLLFFLLLLLCKMCVVFRIAWKCALYMHLRRHDTVHTGDDVFFYLFLPFVFLWSQLLNNTSFIVANSSQDHIQ